MGATSPVARKMAEDAGLDPGSLRGSGASGRVTKDDVLTVLEGGKSSAPAPPVRLRHPPPRRRLQVPRQSGAREERVKMTPLRKRVAERLLAAQSNAAILTTFNEVDMAEVMALRKSTESASWPATARSLASWASSSARWWTR